jgi:hypothetical protein
MANPNFEKIKQSDFNEYYPEEFTDTYKRYHPNDNVFKTWLDGINAGIFMPELHGREHISVQFWMQKLREKDKNVHIAFEYGLVSLLTTGVPKEIKEFRPEFFFDAPDQVPFLKNSIKDGVLIFKKTFGYIPEVFVPSNGIFHPDFDTIVSSNGLKFLYTSTFMPYPHKGKLKRRYIHTGSRGSGLWYYKRNCAFEPTDIGYRGVPFTIKQIEAAFRWGKPANISTHRVNFVGGISPENREKGLSELEILLKEVVKRWPDVEFMSSREAHSIMASEAQA